MLETFIQGLFVVFQWQTFLVMLLGIFLGFWVGLLPGLGGSTTLALMLPFIYKMTPVEAFAFLLGMHSVVSTTGDITSVLFGVPGEGTTAATILDKTATPITLGNRRPTFGLEATAIASRPNDSFAAITVTGHV